MDHAIHSAELFSKCKPILVGTGGLTLHNGLGFYGETDYQIVPEHVSAAVEGNCVKADVKAHSVLVLKISK